MGSADWQRRALAMVASVIYAIVCGVMTRWLARLTEDGDALGTSSSSSLTHTNEMRAMVERDCVERFANVGGHAHAKRELRRIVLTPLRHPRLFYGDAPKALRPPRGVLLHGPPGTGKTMIARAMAGEAGVPLLALHAAALESKWYGESPKLLQAAFSLARDELAPCLVFFDEIDGLGRARQEGDAACVYALKCELLRNLDALGDTPVSVLACTNCPHALDPALRRRFESVVRIDLPTRSERLSILRVITAAECVEVATLRRVAVATDGYSGAALASLAKRASALRLEKGDVRTTARALRVSKDGHALLRALGPLTWESHWAHALTNTVA